MNKILIGMAARFVNDKLQNLLVELFMKIKNFKEKRCYLELAGSGETLQDIKKIKMYNLGDVVIKRKFK